MTYVLPTYAQWKQMPDSLEKWATAAVAYWQPGDLGPWPANIPADEIRDGLERALETRAAGDCCCG